MVRYCPRCGVTHAGGVRCPKAEADSERHWKRKRPRAGFTTKQKREIRRRSGGRCAGCGCTGVPMQADHRVPVSASGKSTLANGQMLCRKCHKAKDLADKRLYGSYDKGQVSRDTRTDR